MATHLQTVYHHEVEMVHVTLVGDYLFLHLGQVLFQVNLDVVEPRAEKDTGHQHPGSLGVQQRGLGATLGLTRIAAAASGGRTGWWDWCPCTLRRATAHFSACTLGAKGDIRYMTSPSATPDAVRGEPSSFTPFPRLMLRVGFARHKLYQSLNDFSRRCLSVSQKVNGEEFNEEGIAFPPEFVVTGDSFPGGKKKTDTRGQPPTKARNNVPPSADHQNQTRERRQPFPKAPAPSTPVFNVTGAGDRQVFCQPPDTSWPPKPWVCNPLGTPPCRFYTACSPTPGCSLCRRCGGRAAPPGR